MKNQMIETAGQFISDDYLHKNFGKIRVREMGVKLREAGLFNSGWDPIFPELISHFLFALFATKSPKYAVEILHKPNSIVTINLLVKSLTDAGFRESINEIFVSQRNADTYVQYAGSGRLVQLYGNGNVNYDGLSYDPEVDTFTRIDRKFLIIMANRLKWPAK